MRKLAVGLGLFLGSIQSASAQWSLVVLHPDGAQYSEARGCDANAQVGIVVDADGRHFPALWRGTASSLLDLTPADAVGGGAYSIRGNRIAGVTYDSTPSSHARLWLDFGNSSLDLNPSTATYSFALGLSEDQVVGYAVVGGVTRASLWTDSAASWIDLSPPEADFSYASGVSNGVQVGSVRIAGRYRAAMWTGSAASIQYLTPEGDPFDSFAIGIDAGQIVGEGWGEGGLWQLPDLSWVTLRKGAGDLTNYASPRAVHRGRQVGVGVFCQGSSGINHAAFWSGTPISGTDLYSAVFGFSVYSYATGVFSASDRATVTGYASMPGYPDLVAVLWTLNNPPPPRCAADLNEDGFVNGDDYDSFAEQFELGVGPDFNGDCFVNGDDYDSFAEAFEAGC